MTYQLIKHRSLSTKPSRLSKQSQSDLRELLSMFKQRKSTNLESSQLTHRQQSPALSQEETKTLRQMTKNYAKYCDQDPINQKDEFSVRNAKQKIIILPSVKKIGKIMVKSKRLNESQEHIISNYLNAQVKIQTTSLKAERAHSHKKKKKAFDRKILFENEQTNESIIDEFVSEKGELLNANKKRKHLLFSGEKNDGRRKEKEKNGVKSVKQKDVGECEFVSIDSEKKEYSLKEEPLKHYAKNKLERKMNEWKKVTFRQLETCFVTLMRKIENANNSIVEKPSKKKPSFKSVPKVNEVSNFIKTYHPQNADIQMIELIKSPNFDIICDEEQLYFGEVFDSKMQGKGVLIRNNYLFEGTWMNNQKAKGYESWELGIYQGQYHQDKKDGRGEFQWANGEFYSGQWKNGKKHGVGLWRSKKGDNYMGEWKMGVVEGQGIHKTFSGQKYEGQFKNFLKNGWGKQKFACGDVYQGNYRNGYPNGKGSYEWSNGAIYEGEFKDGFRDGKGCLKTREGVTYIGEFRQELLSGTCELTLENGDTYQGSMLNGKKHGKGTLKLSKEHKVYEGNWENDQYIY